MSSASATYRSFTHTRSTAVRANHILLHFASPFVESSNEPEARLGLCREDYSGKHRLMVQCYWGQPCRDKESMPVFTASLKSATCSLLRAMRLPSGRMISDQIKGSSVIFNQRECTLSTDDECWQLGPFTTHQGRIQYFLKGKSKSRLRSMVEWLWWF